MVHDKWFFAQAWPFVSIGSSSGSDGNSSVETSLFRLRESFPFSIGTSGSGASSLAGTGSATFAFPSTSGIELGKPLETGVIGCELQGVVAAEDKELSLEETTLPRFPSAEP